MLIWCAFKKSLALLDRAVIKVVRQIADRYTQQVFPTNDGVKYGVVL